MIFENDNDEIMNIFKSSDNINMIYIYEKIFCYNIRHTNYIHYILKKIILMKFKIEYLNYITTI